jgi:hypothetical protein
VVVACQHSNGSLGFTICGECLELVNNCHLLKKGSAACSWLIGVL